MCSRAQTLGALLFWPSISFRWHKLRSTLHNELGTWRKKCQAKKKKNAFLAHFWYCKNCYISLISKCMFGWLHDNTSKTKIKTLLFFKEHWFFSLRVVLSSQIYQRFFLCFSSHYALLSSESKLSSWQSARSM